MLKYYPLTRLISNRYTRGNEFVLPDGKPYAGRYYTLYNGKSFTGVNPALGTNLLLTPIQTSRASNQYISDFRGGPLGSVSFRQDPALAYDIAQSQDFSTQENDKLVELTPYYPIPLESDYQRGYFTRYFAKTVSGPGYVFEISKLDWTKIQNGNVSETVLGYETTDMLWQLTGPLNDVRVSQYQIKGGVYSTNKRVTEGKNKGFRGLVEFIGGDYTKFARITP